jgi:elongation factor G
MQEVDFEFENRIFGGAIPSQFIPSVEKGFRSMQEAGPLIGAPIVQVKVVVDDGKSHSVDSSDLAFRESARGAWRQAVMQANPRILEPIMRIAVEGPSEFIGSIMATLTKRRAVIIGAGEESSTSRVEADVPLSEMFGYATVLRSTTQGKAEFTLEFLRYQPVPMALAEELIERVRKNKQPKGEK